MRVMTYTAAVLVALSVAVPLLFKMISTHAVAGPEVTISPYDIHLRIDVDRLPVTPSPDYV